MARHHTIITGTGRCGSTFLVALFAALGYDTGIDRLDPVDQISNAGLEYNIRLPDCPYISKSPLYCHIIKEILDNDDIHVDHVIIPVRAIEDVLYSRLRIYKITNDHGAPGSSIFTSEYDELEKYTLRYFYKLIYELSASSVPVHIIQFPKFVEEPDYLWRIIPLFKKIKFGDFLDKFNSVCDANLVHEFSPPDKQDS